MTDINKLIKKSVLKLEGWVEDHEYKGFQPFDGLSSWFRPLTFGNQFLDRCLLQLVRQCPINLRPLFGVKPLDSTIGRGYMVLGYCNMFRLTNDEKYKDKIVSCLDWLIENKSTAYEEYSWGKHFDFASRGGLYKAFEPILIWTALIGSAFLEAFELFGDNKHLDVADSACRWITGLPRNQTDFGFCMGYHYQDLGGSVHNSNMVGAALLVRTAKHTKNIKFKKIAKGAIKYSCSRQLPNGAWWYGESPKNCWIDNFHTGYNLDALKSYIEFSGESDYKYFLENGMNFYINHFFEESGRPRYYHNRAYPIDSQCISQSIDTLANFSEYDETLLKLAFKVAKWSIYNMQDNKGFIYYRKYPLNIKARTPMFHWAQATTFKALSHLIFKTISISERQKKI